MATPARNPRVLHFGVFEADLQEAELRKGGIRIKLQDQPFQILSILLERPGETVTREELRQRLWPADTFVDFDHSLNGSIKKLREALGDDSDNPRFIETLHRRGYRFIAPVDSTSAPAPPIELTPAGHLRRVPAALPWFLLVVVALIVYWWARPFPSPRIMNITQLTNDGHDKYAGVDRPLLTDGSRVYCEEANPRAAITQVSVNGGDTSVITSIERFPTPTSDFPTPYHLLDLSPIRSELLFCGDSFEREPPIEALSLPAGQPHRIGDLRGGGAGWSPDGQRIAFVVNGSDLYIAKNNGSESRKIGTVAGSAFGLRWSPDGQRIRFTIEAKGLGAVAQMSSQTLWEVNADGSGLHPLLPGWGNPPNECCGNWTPDGKFFVFQATRDRKSSIWAMRENRSFLQRAASAPVLLTSVSGMNYKAPVVSLDGNRIFVKGAVQRGEVVRYDKQSGQFVPYLGGISAEGLDFSRDRQWVTYVTFPEGSLWRSKVDGRERMQLTFPPMVAFLPRWSPDGKQITFAGLQPGGLWHIYVVSAEGGQPKQMTHGQEDELDVGWSADGTSLVFGNAGAPQSRSISVLNTKTLQLATFPGSDGLWSPRLSPNGRYLAAYPSQPGKLTLYDFATKKWTERTIANPDNLNWSADSRYLYADTLPPTGLVIVRIRMSDRKMEKVADLKHVRCAYGMFGFWSGLAPDGSPLLLRDTGSQEIYALDWQEP